MKRRSEKRPDGNIWKEIIFYNDDVKVALEAWQYAEDEDRYLWGFDETEIQGDHIKEENIDVIEALKLFVELIEKKWDVVSLDIMPKEYQKDANFRISITNRPKRGIEIFITINETEINKELADKLKKIKEIIEGSEK